MKLALFGVGNAGTRLLDQLILAEDTTGRNFTDGHVLAFNTAPAAFEAATAIPEDRQVLIGDTHPEVTHELVSFDPDDDTTAEPDTPTDADSAGVDGDPNLGATVASDELPEIRRSLDLVDDTEVDAAVVIAGLGGGTGAGASSVLLEELQSVYEIPIYVLGVLPAASESDRRALTAARAVRTLVPLADAVLPVDNEAWRRNIDPLDDQYETINEDIATRFVSLFAAGEADPASVSEMRIDPADVRRTLGVGGLATIGYATVDLDTENRGFLYRLKRLLGLVDEEPSGPTDAATIKQLVGRALGSKLTLPCEITSADRVLLILSGPPSAISRKGFETGRYLLEDETGTVEVLAGDEPVPDADTITATVLLSNVTDVPRLSTIQQRAVDALSAFDDESPATSTGETGFEFDAETDDSTETTAHAADSDDETADNDDETADDTTGEATEGDEATGATTADGATADDVTDDATTAETDTAVDDDAASTSDTATNGDGVGDDVADTDHTSDGDPETQAEDNSEADDTDADDEPLIPDAETSDGSA
ncbi:cell division protein FtsZ [Halonotius sp. F2-221B]|uniref:tubulin/FtsZ family protein n=1 Tax=Halonotius sp. F2-221B TaxID=2731620 RepID=UPI00398A6CAA